MKQNRSENEENCTHEILTSYLTQVTAADKKIPQFTAFKKTERDQRTWEKQLSFVCLDQGLAAAGKNTTARKREIENLY